MKLQAAGWRLGKFIANAVTLALFKWVNTLIKGFELLILYSDMRLFFLLRNTVYSFIFSVTLNIWREETK